MTPLSEIGERARRVARSLLDARGADALAGERVAMLVPPGATFLATFFGILEAGGVVVVLSTLHPPAESAYFCEDSGAKVLVVGESLVETARAFAGSRPVLVAESLAGADVVRDLAASRPLAEAPALQLYTSGTTGKPKGAVITHENLGVQQALLAEAWGFDGTDVLLHALPLHHLHGLGISLLTALGASASARMLPSFDAVALWEGMADATIFMAVPTMYAKLFAAFDAAPEGTRERWTANARRLRLATSGSAALPVTLAKRWSDLTGVIPLERFGMTEVGVGMTNPLVGSRRPGYVGRPLPTVDTRVVDDVGNDSDEGELWIAGPSVFAGYHGRPDATADAFVLREGTRWFKTGDRVRRDEDGMIRILGRTSVDILKSGGYKLSALDIEEELREHPAVSEVAVVGVPDETWGERVVACIVATRGMALPDDATFKAFLRDKLAPYKIPKAFVAFESLPRNAMGKVQKPALVKDLVSRGSA
ncbi:MAG: AMP-binding protein [Polyangiaceae bacterium]